jgi:hypothetical protein
MNGAVAKDTLWRLTVPVIDCIFCIAVAFYQKRYSWPLWQKLNQIESIDGGMLCLEGFRFNAAAIDDLINVSVLKSK